MSIIQINDDLKQHWDNFVSLNAVDGGFLHSWDWGELQRSLNNKIFRLGVVDKDGMLQAAALLVKYELPFEYNYLYCPRGPVVNVLKLDDLSSLFLEMKNISREEKSFLLRLDPAWTMGNEKRLTNVGFRKGTQEIQPKCSLVIDLSKPAKDLLADFKPKTRYNIGLAQRAGVKIRASSEIADLEAFWQLTKETAKRDGFSPHPKEHYKKMFEIFAHTNFLKLFLAEYENKIIAANLVSFFGSTCAYLHGASSALYRQVMAPYLAQWQTILEAQRQGFLWYDFGGVNGPSFFKKKWQGVTRFKTGFAPKPPAREYIGSYEIVLNPVIYSMYKFVKQIRG